MLVRTIDTGRIMKKQIIKITIINSLLFSYVVAMNPQRDPEWRCTEHTKSKQELVKLGLLDAALCGAALYVGLKNTVLQSLFESEADPATTPVIVGGAGQRISDTSAEQAINTARYSFALSVLFLCDAGDRIEKIRHYQDYLRHKHTAHNCLTNHQ